MNKNREELGRIPAWVEEMKRAEAWSQTEQGPREKTRCRRGRTVNRLRDDVCHPCGWWQGTLYLGTMLNFCYSLNNAFFIL